MVRKKLERLFLQKHEGAATVDLKIILLIMGMMVTFLIYKEAVILVLDTIFTFIESRWC